jgi:hypothetical protein
MSRRAPTILAATAMILTFVPLPGASGSTVSAGTHHRRVIAPRSGTLLGAHVDTRPHTSRAAEKADVRALESAMGRRLAIDHHFYPWLSPFPTWREAWDRQHGRIPMDTWNGATSASINDGSFDALIRSRAAKVRSFRRPILIRLLPEMDATVKTAITGTPARFIAAWRHVVRIFRARGATNAIWVWCPNAFHFAGHVSQRYYPGDAYVGWICADGYNWSPRTPSGASTTRWTSFHDEFASFYRWGSRRGKPLMVGETGAQEYPGIPGRKANWIGGMGSAVRHRFPKIKALVWYDAIGGSNQGSLSFNWRLNTSAAALHAWVKLGRLPWFRRR